MFARERIIRDRFAKRSCGRCGAPYSTESVVILARRPSHWMVMVSCPHCSHRNVYLISFADAESGSEAGTASTERTRGITPQHSLSPSSSADSAPDFPDADDADMPFAFPPAQTQSAPSIQPINEADVAAMHEFLQEFSGDFQTLFSTPRPHPHPHRKDDPSTS